jgi:hypothetical protein
MYYRLLPCITACCHEDSLQFRVYCAGGSPGIPTSGVIGGPIASSFPQRIPAERLEPHAGGVVDDFGAEIRRIGSAQVAVTEFIGAPSVKRACQIWCEGGRIREDTCFLQHSECSTVQSNKREAFFAFQPPPHLHTKHDGLEDLLEAELCSCDSNVPLKVDCT